MPGNPGKKKKLEGSWEVGGRSSLCMVESERNRERSEEGEAMPRWEMHVGE